MRSVHIYSDPGAQPPIELKRTALAATTIKSQNCNQVQRPRSLFVDRDFKKFAAPGSKVDCAKHICEKLAEIYNGTYVETSFPTRSQGDLRHEQISLRDDNSPFSLYLSKRGNAKRFQLICYNIH